MTNSKIIKILTLILGVFVSLGVIGPLISDDQETVLDDEKAVMVLDGSLYAVTKVVDGDTIKVDIDGQNETIRLIGINTPETVDPRKDVECFGKEASDMAKLLLDGKRVSLEFDDTQGQRDKYGRLLMYVFRDDGLFVNRHLIEQGYGYEYTYNLPYKYQAEFKEAESSAKAGERGLWGDGVCSLI